MIYPQPYSIYLRGTIGVEGFGLEGYDFLDTPMQTFMRPTLAAAAAEWFLGLVL